ncbi:MAG: hypothetical protein ACYDCO_15290 [Armatimonadota bacterium]
MTAPKDFEAHEEMSEEEKREQQAGDQDVRPSGERIREWVEGKIREREDKKGEEAA